MESKYVTGSILAVILAAVVLGTAVGGLTAGSHFIAGVGPKEPATFGGNRISPSMLPAQGTLIVSVIWCSDDTAVYCVPIGSATVTITNSAGAFVAAAQTNAHGQAEFSVNSPSLYKVTADIENVSAFGYMAGPEYQLVQTSAGNSVTAVFQYDQPGPLPW